MALLGFRRSLTVGPHGSCAAEYPRAVFLLTALGAAALGACTAPSRPPSSPQAPAAPQAPSPPAPGTPAPRLGDEIMIAGQLFHTGAPVVLWIDPGGFDAYRVERRFTPWEEASWEATSKKGGGVATPNRYGVRRHNMTEQEFERVRAGGWDLPTLQKVVDQFVIHYDVAGTSRRCFQVLHDARGLSVHFMLDLDGTIYQTLDVKERAWHASTANDRSVGIEIANIGAYPAADAAPLRRWYAAEPGGARLRVPPGEPYSDAALAPARPHAVEGTVQGQRLWMYDLTPQQYDSLARLTATLCTALPGIRCDYPRDGAGALVTGKLPEAELAAYSGLLGHFHVQQNKIDPGPAFQWQKVVDDARAYMGLSPAARPQPVQ